MERMKIVEVGPGVHLVEIPQSGLSVLCGCPENVYKLLGRAGAIAKVEGEGGTWESGPNAILLSEFPVQGGRFCNLVEFPILQMLYRQGMIVPGHPNNSGLRPLLIGHRDDLGAVARYIHLGNYGLSSVDELVASGLGREESEELIRMKRHFAFGSFKSAEELLDFRVVDGPAVELRRGTFLRRLEPNRYQFINGTESAIVDLRLPAGQSYGMSYSLTRGSVPRDHFSVVHIGEGDGWDMDRPCMASLIVYRGEPWLIDAGPQISESLAAIGLGVDDLRGVFVTHAHDDHVVGLTALLHAGRRIRFLSVPWVRATVAGKLHALAGLDEEAFRETFEVRDLVEGAWNDIEGLEVRPFLSPHPVETTCFRFRAGSGSEARSYAHLADLSSFAVIEEMVKDDRLSPGVSRAFAERTKAEYLAPADLKKVDVGGGMIHGDALDFVSDSSADLLLSHSSSPAALEGAPRGRVAAFGEVSILIPPTVDYRLAAARARLAEQFPNSAAEELDSLLVMEPSSRPEGAVIATRGNSSRSVELILSGIVGGPDEGGFAAGSIFGEAECLSGEPFGRDSFCLTRVETLPIPVPVFSDFVSRLELGAERARRLEIGEFLRGCPVFGHIFMTASIGALAARVVLVSYSKGDTCGGGGGDLNVVVSGSVELRSGGASLAVLGPRDVFGEEALFSQGGTTFDAMATEDTTVYLLPLDALRKIPHVLWRLREIMARRMAEARRNFDYRWREEYTVGVPELDMQHRGLFSLVDALAAEINDPAACADIGPSVEALRPVLVVHFRTEEDLMEAAAYEGLGHQRELHRGFLSRFDEWAVRVSCGDRHTVRDFGDFLANWLIGHTLGVDRAYAGKLGALGASAGFTAGSGIPG